MDKSKECLRLWQQIVCRRDVFCQRCGAQPISGHHVFGRKNHGSAYDTLSGIGLCVRCHDGWAREYPGEVHELLKEKIGPEVYESLRVRSSMVVKMRGYDYKQVLGGLKAML